MIMAEAMSTGALVVLGSILLVLLKKRWRRGGCGFEGGRESSLQRLRLTAVVAKCD